MNTKGAGRQPNLHIVLDEFLHSGGEGLCQQILNDRLASCDDSITTQKKEKEIVYCVSSFTITHWLATERVTEDEELEEEGRRKTQETEKASSAMHAKPLSPASTGSIVVTLITISPARLYLSSLGLCMALSREFHCAGQWLPV